MGRLLTSLATKGHNYTVRYIFVVTGTRFLDISIVRILKKTQRSGNSYFRPVLGWSRRTFFLETHLNRCFLLFHLKTEVPSFRNVMYTEYQAVDEFRKSSNNCV
jgi:hypothetical protein